MFLIDIDLLKISMPLIYFMALVEKNITYSESFDDNAP